MKLLVTFYKLQWYLSSVWDTETHPDMNRNIVILLHVSAVGDNNWRKNVQKTRQEVRKINTDKMIVHFNLSSLGHQQFYNLFSRLRTRVVKENNNIAMVLLDNTNLITTNSLQLSDGSGRNKEIVCCVSACRNPPHSFHDAWSDWDAARTSSNHSWAVYAVWHDAFSCRGMPLVSWSAVKIKVALLPQNLKVTLFYWRY